jgi:hypothetical protein
VSRAHQLSTKQSRSKFARRQSPAVVPPLPLEYICTVVTFANDARHRTQSMEVVMAVAVQDDYPQHASDYRTFLKVVRYVLAFLAILLLGMEHFLT